MNTIRTPPHDDPTLLAQLKRWIERQFATMLLNMFQPGTIMGQALANSVMVAGVGEDVADGMDYPILIAYTSPVLNASGGPVVGDSILKMTNRPGSRIVLGKVVHPH